ncbi:MAG TPA: glyceraldehyde 3-phosphate dehydrogenase NAD-binding domain-containing protein, partial [bacterium]|nr:glyceraldehyde 3-phosphate dehydrogenase NAD-binding domain-containing protein [bacterium]
MAVRVGINGFGRMGRLALRTGWGSAALQFAHINEVKGGAAAAAHLLKFDSLHGRWAPEVRADTDRLFIGEQALTFSEHAKPAAVPWRDLGVDLVLECSGKFTTEEALAPYFEAGVKKVVVAAPVKRGALNIVMGVNDSAYRPREHHLLTAASCTTNCL